MPRKASIGRGAGFFRKDLETMPPDSRLEYLTRNLKAAIRHAYKHSVALKEKFDAARLKPEEIRTLQDLEKIPITKKSDLVELQKRRPPFGGLEGVPIQKLRRIYVSPGPIHEPGEVDYEEIAWAEAMIAAGFRPGDIAVNTFSYHMVPFALHMLDNTLYKIGCITVPSGTGNTEQQVHVLKDLKATAFLGTASFLLTIADKSGEMGLDPRKDLSLRAGFVATEMLPESLRSKLEDRFGMTIRQSYGTADIGCLGYECMEKNGMHLPDDKIVEIVDPETGKQLPAGQAGEIVATTFNNVYPLIRFGTGDLSYLTEAPCPCGRTSQRLVRILGRIDQMTKVRGLFIHPGQASEIASRHPLIAGYQFVITRREDRDEMVLRVELKEEVSRLGKLKEEIERSIRDVMKLRGSVAFVPRGTIPDQAKRLEDQRTWD